MPKREKIQEMFDNIAPEYDRLNHIMSLDVDKTWRKRALTQIFKQTVGEPELKAEGCGMKVLDIACGTGDFSIAIAEEMETKTIGTTTQNIRLMNTVPIGSRQVAPALTTSPEASLTAGQTAPVTQPAMMPTSIAIKNP